MDQFTRFAYRLRRCPPPHRPTAAGLERTLAFALEYRPGWPFHVPTRVRVIDMACCASMACASCGWLGLECRPWHRGEVYRIVACCLTCGSGEEV